MLYKLTNNGTTVSSGELVDVIRLGNRIKEARNFFNVPKAFFFDNPTVSFLSSDRRTTTELALNRTSQGYAATFYEYGKMFGCNLNRIRNRAGRWGLTVWVRPTEEKAAASL